MARRTSRELEIADHLWDCLTRIADDCGTDRHAVVNQAIYELARRFNFLTPMAKEVAPPDQPVAPGRAAPVSPAAQQPQAPVSSEQQRPNPGPSSVSNRSLRNHAKLCTWLIVLGICI